MAALCRLQLVTGAIDGNVGLVQAVIKEYPTEVDTLHKGVGALHEASRHGHLEIIKLLAKNSADLNLCDLEDNTPLHFAVKGNRPKAVELLLKLGANMYDKNLSKKTAAMLAYENNYSECMQKFLQKDEHVQLKDDGGVDENLEKEMSSEDDDVVELCVFCTERPGIMQAEPCKHKFCFLCIYKNDACRKCGTIIQKFCCTKTKEMTDYIHEIEKLDNKIEELETMHKCSICKENPINCMLWCGHMFCTDCVHKWRNERRDSPADGPFVCFHCKKSRKYTKLYTQWKQKDESHTMKN